MKKLFSLLALSIFMFTSCEKNNENKTNIKKDIVTITVGAPKAPPLLPILRMQETNALGDNVKFDIKFWKTPENLIAMVQSKEADIYAFPLTVLAKLYNKGMDVKLLNVNTWGVEAFLTTDPNLKKWSDIKGKTIYISLKSSPPDVFTHYFLSKAGLTEGKDYNVIYTNKAELAKMFIINKATDGTLIEPLVTMVTMKNPNVRVAFRFDDEWQKLKGNDSHIPTAGIGALGSFIKEHPELTTKFNEEYEKALKWIVKNPEEAGKLAEEKIGINAKVIQKAIPNMGLNFVPAKDVKSTLNEYFKLLFEYNKNSIGGKIPNEGIYFEK